MTIGLVCPAQPKEGQRWLELRRKQAEALVWLGHTVHLLGHHLAEQVAGNNDLHVHRLPLPLADTIYSEQLPSLNGPLAYSQQLFERLADIHAGTPLTLVDFPLSQAAGLVTQTYLAVPVVVTNLSTVDASAPELLALEQECLHRAAGVIIPEDHFASHWPIQRATPSLNFSMAGPVDAEALIRFYRQISQAYAAGPKRARRVYQVGVAIDNGDAVGNIIRCNARLLPQVGGESIILAKYAHPQVAAEVTEFHPARVRPDDGLIFHYWGYSELADFVMNHPGPKALYYHNITPPDYFPPGSHNYEMCRRGYEQVAKIASYFDLIVGVSKYDIADLRPYLTHPTPALVVPPLLAMAVKRAVDLDETVYRQIKAAAPINFLFVGRVARNKRQDLLMQMFDYYNRFINRHSRLYLVGSSDHSPDYSQELEALRRSLAARDQIIFTGKISDADLYAYYRAADVFVSASEHEGFGVPLLEAMAHNVPVVALASSAVPETMGHAGVLIRHWDAVRVAELINLLLKDEDWHAQLLVGQRDNLQRFSTTSVRDQLENVVKFLKQQKLKESLTIPDGI